MRRLLRSGVYLLEFCEPGRSPGAGQRRRFDDLRAATTWLARFLADPSDARCLRRLAASLARGAPLHDDRDVLATIAAALIQGRLALVRPGPPQEPVAAAPAEEPTRLVEIDDFERITLQRQQHHHWIEIRLVDEDGEVITGERCRIVTSDGVERTGYTDITGVARWTQLPPGPCKLSFPDLDAGTWDELPNEQ